jgi:hypothetical protein
VRLPRVWPPWDDDLREERACVVAEACAIPYEQAREMVRRHEKEEEAQRLGNRSWAQKKLI